MDAAGLVIAGCPRHRTLAVLGCLIGIGVLGRIVLAYATYGLQYDINSFEIVEAALLDSPLHVYSETSEPASRWPYLPGFFPWILISGFLEREIGLPAHGTIQLPQIVADGAIAALVFAYLTRRGAGSGASLLAAGLVMFGPTFAATSGYHGQLDSLAILPAVAALVVWERSTSSKRWLPVGALIAAGTAIKTVPILMLLALLPSARSRSELVCTMGAALALPALLIAPFVLADGPDALNVLSNAGVPGFGGLSLAAQPNLSQLWLAQDQAVSFSEVTQALADASRFIAIATGLAVAGLLLRYRPPPVHGAVVIWLAVYVFNPGVWPHYLVWGLPFFLMAGYVRQALALQLAVLAPTIILYASPWQDTVAPAIYAVVMICIWAWAAGALATQVSRMVRRGPPPRATSPTVAAPTPA